MKRSVSRKKCYLILIAVIVLLTLILLYLFNYIPHLKYDNSHFGINTYKSLTDKDGDGIDDQTDILKNTRKYIKTKPKYESRYYAGGYPDDGYGVCTDVVAFALKDAGYDLMELLDDDIEESPESYSIETPDKNIDFRRVSNLKIWFKRNAISLTTDIYDIGEWQGGDVIIFEGHIGIVSDKRNRDGIPFIIHHANPYQARYEEDILPFRSDVVGHYRIS